MVAVFSSLSAHKSMSKTSDATHYKSGVVYYCVKYCNYFFLVSGSGTHLVGVLFLLHVHVWATSSKKAKDPLF